MNERTRAFLRLERLFHKLEYLLKGKSHWESLAALDVILDVHSLCSRDGLKSDLIKELDRLIKTLQALQDNPQVDQKRITQFVTQLAGLNEQIHQKKTPFGFNIKQQEFVNLYKQRSNTAPIICDFDLPPMHLWLQQPMEKRLADLQEWGSDFELLRDAIYLILTLVRESTLASPQLATKGQFFQNLETTIQYQLVRVTLPMGVDYFPEISGNRHRISVRFLALSDMSERPKQLEEDVEFLMSSCAL